ncbi:enoyl-CoA hydratase-related protein [Sulfitobacter sp. F26169L]|uniref:enoyl-CoA hydratase/isomerase family protein n=1 Tax=Sulfitobacter sp. F26169L TaxID=2996015 RepID=UPI002260ED72|nr:enoyl-CoA hydratase-related protein [Sulfitobacter sp. F26169L]MCX7568105.1 enoyl-CoA hydratase-related protein [Sulfitobacter sp. F26169L]
MPFSLPACETLMLTQRGSRLDVVLNRPESRNAINARMAAEFSDLLDWLAQTDAIRLVVLRGAGGHFCAGGDIKERRTMGETPPEDGGDPILARNARAGRGFLKFQNLPQTTIAAVEGSAFGGGLGYACMADITIVTKGARMGMPETRLGIAPAQIAPFVVKRVGLARARQLALTASRFGGQEAYDYGIAQYLCEDRDLDKTLEDVAAQVMACAPKASAATKEILLAVGTMPDDELATFAATRFAALSRGPEGREGQTAFAQKRAPNWVDAEEGEPQ